MAVDASTSSTILGAPVTSAGVNSIVFNVGAAPPATSAYWNYDGTNLVGNVPTGKGFSFTVGGTAKVAFSNAGAITAQSDITAPGNFISSNTVFVPWINGVTNIANGSAVTGNPANVQGQFAFQHLAGGSTAMGVSRCLIGLGAGTTSSGTAVTASGHDIAGRIGVTVNSTGTVSQPILLAQFAAAYASPPFMSLYPANAATASIALATAPFAVTTTSGFSVMANTTGIPAGTYAWYYSAVIQ